MIKIFGESISNVGVFFILRDKANNVLSPPANGSISHFSMKINDASTLSLVNTKNPPNRMDLCLSQSEGFALDFCSTFWILSIVMFRKNLRSPFQNNAPCCFVHCVRSPVCSLSKAKNGTPIGIPFCFGAEGGIRTLVSFRPN